MVGDLGKEGGEPMIAAIYARKSAKGLGAPAGEVLD